MRCSTFINQTTCCVPPVLPAGSASLLPARFVSFRLGWVIDCQKVLCIRKRDRAMEGERERESCLEVNCEGVILSIAIRPQYIILFSDFIPVGPSTFLKLLLSTLCFANYHQGFHLSSPVGNA